MAAQAAAAARGRFAAALSGGETPRALYRHLARQQFAQKVPWRRVHLYWGDERCVPPDDPASNYAMAREAFIKHVPIAADNVHRMRGEDDPEAAAARLRGRSCAPWRSSSVLPARCRSSTSSSSASVATATRPRSSRTAPPWTRRSASASPPRRRTATARLTVTWPVINSARRVMVLVAGADKAGMVAEVFEGFRLPKAVPAQAIAPVKGQLLWLMDEAAAAELGPASRG